LEREELFSPYNECDWSYMMKAFTRLLFCLYVIWFAPLLAASEYLLEGSEHCISEVPDFLEGVDTTCGRGKRFENEHFIVNEFFRNYDSNIWSVQGGEWAKNVAWMVATQIADTSLDKVIENQTIKKFSSVSTLAGKTLTAANIAGTIQTGFEIGGMLSEWLGIKEVIKVIWRDETGRIVAEPSWSIGSQIVPVGTKLRYEIWVITSSSGAFPVFPSYKESPDINAPGGIFPTTGANRLVTHDFLRGNESHLSTSENGGVFRPVFPLNFNELNSIVGEGVTVYQIIPKQSGSVVIENLNDDTCPGSSCPKGTSSTLKTSESMARIGTGIFYNSTDLDSKVERDMYLYDKELFTDDNDDRKGFYEFNSSARFNLSFEHKWFLDSVIGMENVSSYLDVGVLKDGIKPYTLVAKKYDQQVLLNAVPPAEGADNDWLYIFREDEQAERKLVLTKRRSTPWVENQFNLPEGYHHFTGSDLSVSPGETYSYYVIRCRDGLWQHNTGCSKKSNVVTITVPALSYGFLTVDLLIQEQSNVATISGLVNASDDSPVSGVVSFQLEDSIIAANVLSTPEGYYFSRNFDLPDTEQLVDVIFTSTDGTETSTSVTIPAKTIVDDGSEPDPDEPPKSGTSLTINTISIVDEKDDDQRVVLSGYVKDNQGNNNSGKATITTPAGSSWSTFAKDYDIKGSFFEIDGIKKEAYERLETLTIEISNGLTEIVSVTIPGTSGLASPNPNFKFLQPNSQTRWRIDTGNSHYFQWSSVGIDPEHKYRFHLYTHDGSYVHKLGRRSAIQREESWLFVNETPGLYKIRVQNETTGEYLAWSDSFLLTDVNDRPESKDQAIVAFSGQQSTGTVWYREPNNDPATLTVSTEPVNGIISLQPSGSFTYTANEGATGSDNFYVDISDGDLVVQARISVILVAGTAVSDFELQKGWSNGSAINDLVVANNKIYTAGNSSDVVKVFDFDGNLLDTLSLGSSSVNKIAVAEGYIVAIDNAEDLYVFSEATRELLWLKEDIGITSVNAMVIGEGHIYVAFDYDTNSGAIQVEQIMKYNLASQVGSRVAYDSGEYYTNGYDIESLFFYRFSRSGNDIVLFSGTGGRDEDLQFWQEDGNGTSGLSLYKAGTEGFSDDVTAIFARDGYLYGGDDSGNLRKMIFTNTDFDSFGVGSYRKDSLHSSDITEIYSDGNELFTGSRDKSIKIWNDLDGALKQSIDISSNEDAHTSEIIGLAFVDGLLISGSSDGSIKVWGRNYPPVASANDIVTWSGLSQPVAVNVFDLNSSDSHYFSIAISPTNGTVTTNENGDLVYTPNGLFFGQDSFDVLVSDGKASTQVTVKVIVKNRAPDTVISITDFKGIGTIGEAITLVGSGIDSENAIITEYQWSLIELPAGSTASLSSLVASNTQFMPDVIGLYTVSLRASDGNSFSEPKIIDISVTNFSPTPTISNFEASINNTTLAFIDVGDANTLDNHTFAVVSEPQHGNVTISSSGILSFNPDEGYVGEDSFTVMVTDNWGATSTVVVNFSVENTVPVAINSSLDVVRTQHLSEQLKGYDANGHSLLFSLVSQPVNGIFTLDDAGTGAFTFNASDEFVGQLTVTFKVNDGYIDSQIGTLAINVLSDILDTDSDSIPDHTDNCTTVSNVDQLNTDGANDGGDACDDDDDNDTIRDEYELANGLNPLDANDATLDADNDQLTNLQEFTLGTNPNNNDTDGDGIIDGLDSSPLDILISSIQVNDTELARCITEKTIGLTTVSEVTTLDCSNFAIESLEGISQLTELESLSLHGTKISSFNGVEGLGNLTSLHTGNVSTLTDISAIADMSQLTNLYLYDTSVADIGVLANLINLTELDTTGTLITDYSVLAQFQQLTWLGLNNSVNDLSPYAGLVKLDFLVITSTLIDYNQLAAFPRLTSLGLIDNSFNDLTKLSSIATQLSYLTVDSSSLINLQNINAFTNLSTLFLSGSPQLVNISGIGQLSLLKALSFSGTKVSDISSLASLFELTYLYIDRAQVSDLSPLFTLVNLSRVSVRDIPLNDANQIQVLKDRGVQVLGTPKLTNDIELLELSNLVEAIASPGSDSILYNGLNTEIVWDVSTLSGNNIDIYVLHDDPSDIGGGTNVDLTLLQARNWYKFSDNVINDGSVTLDPAVMNGSGNTYKLLLITDTGKWAISDGIFSLMDQVVITDSDSDGIPDAEDAYPELPSFKLTINSDSNQGLITSDVGALNCGEECVLQLLSETKFTLNFTPNNGFVYHSISSEYIGCRRGSSASYCNDIAGVGNHQVQINFVVDTDNDGVADEFDKDDDNDSIIDSIDLYPITPSMHLTLKAAGVGSGSITVIDSDISCNDECVVQLIEDSEFSITAIPEQGFTTLGWNGSENLGCRNGSGKLFCNDIAVVGYVVAQINFDVDTDLDGEGNSIDSDDDGDNYLDTDEIAAGSAPLNNESRPTDTDGDFISDVTDTDDDNDGVLDIEDAFPLDAAESVDTNGNGIGNNTDTDDDGDGIVDSEDEAPLDNTIGDSQAPVFGEIIEVTFEATGVTTAIELVEPEVTDNNLNTPTLVSNYSEALTLGSHEVTWTATDFAGNTATSTQQVHIIDTTAPEFAEAQIQTINARGLVTNITNDISLVAHDIVDGDIAVQIVGDTVLSSGEHLVVVSAEDASGNVVKDDVNIHINPRVELTQNTKVEPGATIAIPVYLSGDAAVYPVVIDYTITGVDLQTYNHQLIIEADDKGLLPIVIPSGAVDGEVVKVALTSTVNAVLGNVRDIELLVVAENNSPTLQVALKQNNKLIKVVDSKGGVVTVTATIIDMNALDTHDITWSANNDALVDIGTDSLSTTFEFSPESLESNTYGLSVQVKENNTSELYEISIATDIVVDTALPTLSDTDDTDSDGIPDSKESFADSDQDGIADYLDNDNNPSHLPIGNNSAPMQTINGLTLSLGDVVSSANGVSAQDAAVDINDITENGGENGSEVDNSLDAHFETVSTIINFNLSGLSEVGVTVPVVIPLADGDVISAGSTYRKYNAARGWYNFVEDDDNAILSALTDSDGNCPAPLSKEYKQGLNVGDDCIELLIKDGGENDADGLANGMIKDPGVLATKTPNQSPVINLVNAIEVNEIDDVTLDASATTDAENDKLTFLWSQLTGSDVSLSGTDTTQLSFSTPSVSHDELLTFELVVYDGRDSVTATVEVLVLQVNALPTVLIESHASSFNEGASVSLSAQGIDKDNDTLTYSWEQVTDLKIDLSGSSSSNISFNTPEVDTNQTLELKVTVFDGTASTSATTSIIIKNVIAPVTPPKESSDGGGSGGSMAWLFILLGLASLRGKEYRR